QYVPMAVEKQAAVIWAVTNGYADDVDVAQIRRFEAELLSFLENSKGSLLAEIPKKDGFSKDVTAQMHTALKEFKDRFNAQAKAAKA
ncbi:MAG TPA: hypothetical protein PKA94_01810, partial [Ferruginibacter sp.]|nr:hypothetical protein [Ferruginibacter sp.]